jgi:hypothetical protein
MNVLFVIGFVIVLLLLINFFLLYKKSMLIRLNLESFTIVLLLDETIAKFQSSGLREYVKNAKSNDQNQLNHQARSAIQRFANDFAQTGSMVLARSLLWKAKTGEE